MAKLINKNSFKFGLLISILIPVILFAIVFFIRFHDKLDYFWYVKDLRKSLPKLLSLCVFPNGIIFYYYILKNKALTMRGMLIGTVILALIVLILFFVAR